MVNKPPGLVVHPGAGHRAGTLLNALVHHCPDLKDIGEVSRPGLVHRLDKDTSGLIVVAKTSLAHASLVAQFQAHAITKRYQALVWGRLPEIEGEIDKEVGRHPTARQKMSVHARRGKRALTFWRVMQEFPGPLTLVELTPQTGRTHQLRVHLASEGHPVLGDSTYGGGVSRLAGHPQLLGLKPLVHRQLLHAWRLGVTHPRTGETADLGDAAAGGFSGGGGLFRGVKLMIAVCPLRLKVQSLASDRFGRCKVCHGHEERRRTLTTFISEKIKGRLSS